jgi:adenylate cyclase
MSNPVPFFIIGLFAIGMAVAFFTSDRHSPTSRALSLLFALLGVNMLANIPAYGGLWLTRDGWARFFSLMEVADLAVGLEWVLRIGRTGTSPSRNVQVAERLLRVAQALVCVYGLVGVLLPDVRLEVWNRQQASRWEYYLFAVPLDLALLCGVVRIAQLAKGEFDPAERVRVLGLVVAAPFWLAGIFMPRTWMPVTTAIGEVLFLVGAIRYHVLQGQRGQFLSRFVSPEVARAVRERGLASALQRTRVELSVVACDLRGFTAFAETGAPEEVMKLLEEYYAAVGEAVAQLGGTIKDFAGDGILALVGAPIPLADHARRAVELALAIRERGDGVLARWRTLGLDLGLGVGVASGFATVGAIGAAGRLEYGAVGPVVNLASRLASHARADEVLAEPRVVGLAGEGPFRFEKLDPVELKGFARPVTIFVVVSPGEPMHAEAARH